jgi:ESS family glutamate:Na+ symporter
MAVLNRGVRHGNARLIQSTDLSRAVRTGIADDHPGEVGARLTFFGGAIDTMTFHFALVGAIYLATYGLMVLIGHGLVTAGLAREVPTLWSLNFVFANLIALGVRSVMDRNGGGRLLDDGTVNRMTGLLADVLIAASIMAISLRIAWQYIGPILVMAALGAWITYVTIKWAVGRTFEDYPFERTVGLYGEQTGTISSGLALIRVMDPEFGTSVAQDQVLASAVTLAVGFPLLILINLPLAWFGGAMKGYALVVGLLLAYLVILLAGWWLFVGRKKALAHGSDG